MGNRFCRKSRIRFATKRVISDTNKSPFDKIYFIDYNDFTETVKGRILMKQNLIENQYVQLAKEQFCQIMKTVPFVSDIEIIPTGLGRGFGDFHAIVYYSDNDESQRFCVEVKSNGEKRFVNMFMLMASQHNDDTCYVFMAPYISESSADSLFENNYSYIDLSGNCYILSKRITRKTNPRKFDYQTQSNKLPIESH